MKDDEKLVNSSINHDTVLGNKCFPKHTFTADTNWWKNNVAIYFHSHKCVARTVNSKSFLHDFYAYITLNLFYDLLTTAI